MRVSPGSGGRLRLKKALGNRRIDAKDAKSNGDVPINRLEVVVIKATFQDLYCSFVMIAFRQKMPMNAPYPLFVHRDQGVLGLSLATIYPAAGDTSKHKGQALPDNAVCQSDRLPL